MIEINNRKRVTNFGKIELKVCRFKFKTRMNRSPREIKKLLILLLLLENVKE